MQTSLFFQVEVLYAPPRFKPAWCHFARLRLSDDTTLFSLLAGVRLDDTGILPADCATPKGLPDDVVELSLLEDSLAVDDVAAGLDLEDTCTRARADEWVREGHSRYLCSGYRVTHPDFHSFSWLSPAEFGSVVEKYRQLQGRDSALVESVAALLDSLTASGIHCRVVIWFTD